MTIAVAPGRLLRVGPSNRVLRRVAPAGDPPTFSVQPSFSASSYTIGDTVTISEGTADGGATLTVEVFTLAGVDKSGELVGTTWDSTGESAGTLALQIRATNEHGSTLSDTINATLAEAPSETDFSFGALTLAGAGGVAKPAGATSITGGTATGYTISSGFVVPSSTGSATSGTILFNDGTEWTVSAAADEYSVRTVAEMVAVNGLGVTTLNNKTMRLRPGEYDVVGSDWFDNRSFATGFTVASHDTDAFPGIGGASHSRVKVITSKNASQESHQGMARVTFDGICIEGWADRRTSIFKNARPYVLHFGSSATDITFQNCWLKGDNDVIGGGSSFFGCIGGSTSLAFSGSIGCRIVDCRLSDMTRLLNWNVGGRREVARCQIDGYQGDGIVLGDIGEISITENLFYRPMGDTTDVTWKGGARASINSSVTGISDATTGTFHFRFRPMIQNARQVLWCAQAADGTQFAAFEITSANKMRFWAADATGTTRVDLTSAATIQEDITQNVLVSVDNAGTNRMFVWQSSGKQGTAADTETVSAAGTGHTLNWDCGGMGYAANNTSSVTNAWNDGTISRAAFWPGAVDVTSASVRADFFNEDTVSGEITEGWGSMGQPPLDVRGTLRLWRSNIPINEGSAPEGMEMRTSSQSSFIDTYHVDVMQGITNGGSPNINGNDTGGPIEIARNVFIDQALDGEFRPGGGQGIFLEDIRGDHCYVQPRIHNNLLVYTGSWALFIANPEEAKVRNNTVAHLIEMQIDGYGVPTNQFSHHDPYSYGWQIDVDGKSGTIAQGDIMTGGGKSVYVWEVVAQTATTASVRIVNWDGDSVVTKGAGYFADNTPVTFTGGATATTNGAEYEVDTPAEIRASGYSRSNISRNFTDTIGCASPDAHPVLIDNIASPVDFTGQLGAFFKGLNGDGTGFALADLATIDDVKNMFRTSDTLNLPGVVKVGYDGYWNEESPWDGTCDAFTVPDRVGAGESDFVAPASVSAGGIAVHADSAANIELRLFDASEVAISDWTARPLHLSAGEKFKVRRTSGTGPTTVYAGDHTDTWTVS